MAKRKGSRGRRVRRTSGRTKDPRLQTVDRLLKKLFPLNRSLTGQGNQETISILSQEVELRVHKVRSGSKVFDWTVPPEWWIKGAYVKNRRGKKIIDFQKSNLHVVNYSLPIRARMSGPELRQKLHTLPQLPTATPYRTSYYRRDWGLCAPHSLLGSKDFVGPFEVVIDSGFKQNGHLIYADRQHKGSSASEILISTYCCHPSMANDNLSGLVTATLLFKEISRRSTHFSYRLLIAPETIGAIAFLATRPKVVRNIVAGAVLSTTGGRGPLGLKHAFDETHWVDRLACMALNEQGRNWKRYPFVPDGSDERQYASPGIRIPTVTICKSKYYEYPEYHTSLDNLDLVTAPQILETLDAYIRWFELIESNRIYKRAMPYGEFQLGQHGLIPMLGGTIKQGAAGVAAKERAVADRLDAIGWLMFGCDGQADLLSLSERSALPMDSLKSAANVMVEKGLLRIVG
jgi:aminopeptidase-like protein